VTSIRAVVPQAKLKTAVMDLSSLMSVRAFAAQQLADPGPIDTLINNAGVMAIPKRKLSVDGFEMQFATNVLGHFLLTGLLLQSILRATGPRVVTVASYAHVNGGPVPIEDLNSEQSYKPVKAYSKTKLANVLFARELQRRAGARLLSTTCHPGYARTNLQFNGEAFSLQITALLLLPFSHSAAKGAEPTLFAATAPDAKPAGYYGPGGLFGLSGNVKQTEMATFAYDDGAAEQLFDQLEELAGVRYAL
jgi:NAD(P)-dependent dehydrogenase (short-subunit alcohol dehydrogenase family)